MGWFFIETESEGGSKQQMRSNMRDHMRGGYRHYGGGVNMRDQYEQGYREGYKHGWEDSEDDSEENYRRGRDSRGRYM